MPIRADYRKLHVELDVIHRGIFRIELFHHALSGGRGHCNRHGARHVDLLDRAHDVVRGGVGGRLLTK